VAAPVLKVFRSEAVRNHAQPVTAGQVVRISPEWVRSLYLLLLMLAPSAVGLAAIAPLAEYAEGPAVVRVDGRDHLVAPAAATVDEVMVVPGTRVAAGQVLVDLQSTSEQQEVARVDREWELQLVNLLLDPGEAAPRNALAGLRAERERAHARLQERSLRASAAGVVSEVWVRAGQAVTAGERLVSIAGPGARSSIVVALPGDSRPLLHPGMMLRLRLDGFREHQEVRLGAIADEVVGPNEVRRFLGQELSEAVPVSGPVVLVHADLDRSWFEAEGRHYSYFPGMLGHAWVRLQTRSVLQALLPLGRSWAREDR
jgi:multidrug efflux pump subunit AcrA (membrane-fusion protein)